jgi:hypothetical protein
MTSFKNLLWLLVLASSVPLTGCGDSDDGDDGKGDDDGADVDAGGGGDEQGDASAGGGAQCASDGIFAEFTASDLEANVADTGACISTTDVDEVCETNPSATAANSGTTCALNGLSGEAFTECVVNGTEDGTVEGILDVSTELSEACAGCYADAVNCSKDNCFSECVGKGGSEECQTCREEQGCNEAFFSCSGLPRPEEIAE